LISTIRPGCEFSSGMGFLEAGDDDEEYGDGMRSAAGAQSIRPLALRPGRSRSS
jgi:hypothetical protein